VSFLSDITARRRDDARSRASQLSRWRDQAAASPPARGFGSALKASGLSLIAEIKRSSPSVGAINTTVDPRERAATYESAGAHAISVLTEPDSFKGSLDDLAAARSACELPILRKDFLSEPLHLAEARATGADAVLLIVAALDPGQLVDLHAEATEMGLDVLVEVHEPREVEIALEAGARIVGINTRNLMTLEVDSSQIARVRPEIPSGITVVAESGIKTRADVAAIERVGVDAILVGETLMRSENVNEKIRELLAL
jgi:indole-3-glycerol phosphate synthase